MGSGAMPTLAHAVERITHAAHEQWTRYALGAPLPDGSTINPRSGTYARSIQVRQTGELSGPVGLCRLWVFVRSARVPMAAKNSRKRTDVLAGHGDEDRKSANGRS